MQLLAPAKINWFLHVGDRRPDGYHDILSLIQFIDLYDEIEIDPHNEIIVETDLNIPQEENIAYKVACKLKKESGYKGGARIKIKKNIPHGAGLGGGSSDGASTLIGLNKLWNLGLSIERLSEIGATVGSDIVLFLNGPAAFVSGRGEIVEKIDLKDSNFLLLIKPALGICTAWAYNEFDRIRMEQASPENLRLAGLKELYISVSRAFNSKDWSAKDIFKNDLEEPVFRYYPFLKEVKERLLQEGALYSSMTGSGSALFGVFRTEEEAAKASKAFKGFWTKVTRTLIE